MALTESQSLRFQLYLVIEDHNIRNAGLLTYAAGSEELAAITQRRT